MYDLASEEIAVRLAKSNPGQVFPGLDLVSQLLAPPPPPCVGCRVCWKWEPSASANCTKSGLLERSFSFARTRLL